MATTKYKRKIKFATTKQVLAQIEKWDSSVVKCRSWRHAWEEHNALQSSRAFVEIHRCSRCGAFRHRVLNPNTGAVVDGWAHDLPADYPMPPGEGRIAGAALNPVRVAAMRTQKVEHVDHVDLYRRLNEELLRHHQKG